MGLFCCMHTPTPALQPGRWLQGIMVQTVCFTSWLKRDLYLLFPAAACRLSWISDPLSSQRTPAMSASWLAFSRSPPDPPSLWDTTPDPPSPVTPTKLTQHFVQGTLATWKPSLYASTGRAWLTPCNHVFIHSVCKFWIIKIPSLCYPQWLLCLSILESHNVYFCVLQTVWHCTSMLSLVCISCASVCAAVQVLALDASKVTACFLTPI